MRKALQAGAAVLAVAALALFGVARLAGRAGEVAPPPAQPGHGTSAVPGAEPSAAAAPVRRVPVEVTPAALRDFEERLAVQGTVEARRFALVSARVAGAIEHVYVDEGDAVKAGETRLFQIDALKLRKAVEISEQALAVARCGRREKEANLDLVRVDLDKAQSDNERYRHLHNQNVISTEEYEQVEVRLRQAQAMLRHAQSLVDLSTEEERQRQTALEVAQKDLQDSLVYAPISGVVTERIREPGEMGEVAKPVLRIDDLSTLEVSAFLPADVYARVIPGTTPVRVQVGAATLGECRVSYRGPTVHPKLRTFEMKCELQNPPAGVVPGAMAELTVILACRRALGVPKPAVLQRGGRSVVFVVRNACASQVEVRTGLETAAWVEVAAEALAEAAPVITTGQLLVADGVPVTVRAAEER